MVPHESWALLSDEVEQQQQLADRLQPMLLSRLLAKLKSSQTKTGRGVQHRIPKIFQADISDSFMVLVDRFSATAEG